MPNEYIVWEDGNEDDSMDYEGFGSAAESAQAGADPDGGMSHGEERIICVRDSAGKLSRFKVTADMRYLAEEIPDGSTEAAKEDPNQQKLFGE